MKVSQQKFPSENFAELAGKKLAGAFRNWHQSLNWKFKNISGANTSDGDVLGHKPDHILDDVIRPFLVDCK